MPVNLKNRSVLEMSDFSREEIRFLLELSKDLKRAKYAGTEIPRLRGRNLCLIFEKTSTRTRCAFEVAAYDQGMGVTYLDPTGSQIGHKESIKDTARVLGRMFDATCCTRKIQIERRTCSGFALEADCAVVVSDDGLHDR